MHTLNYLAYGSNLLPARLAARVGDIRVVGTVALTDWALTFDKRGQDGSGKCTLVRTAGARAWGTIYAISTASRPTLDRIEGLGRGYDAHELELEDYGACYVYLAPPAARDTSLKPYEWYQRLVLAGARAHAFPAAYLATLAGVAVTADPDRKRAEENLALLR